jgi:hypothetical protein
MNKFEQLIEYVINDEEAKARELFHNIVVEKSRAIYEEMMEAEEEEESIEEAQEEQEESIEEAEEEEEESIEEALGGDQADDLIDDVEAEEEGMMEDDAEFDDEAEDAGDELTHDIEGAHDEGGLEDRVVDLEDKLDELMAEFESLMGDEAGEEAHSDMDDGMTDMEVADDEYETEGLEENINLKAAPAPVKSEDAGINKKAVVAANSGARGAAASPVKMTGDTAQGRSAPTTKDLIGKVQNTPAQGSVKQSPATKPHLAQATGVNTKSPVA